jgi:hypothetical protein
VPAARGDSRKAYNGTRDSKMGKQIIAVLYIVVMVVIVVAVDFLFFRNRFWERLMANVGIVLVFAAFYFRFLKRS